jgi:hypothetical protein
MPVSQADTATTVASTGTYDVARFGIEGRSVRDGRRPCQPPGRMLGQPLGRCESAYGASVFDSRIRNLRSQIPDCGQAVL